MSSVIFPFVLFALLTLSLNAIGKTSPNENKLRFETLFTTSDVIWGFDFLPDGRILFSERLGKLNIFDPKTKKIQTLKNVPIVHAVGQGGMLDVKLHPNFRQNQIFFFTYSEPVGNSSTTVLAQARLQGDSLTDFKKLFSAEPAGQEDIHYGSRILIKGSDIYFTVGDRNDRPKVQDLSFHNGKILRLHLDGKVPKDNPFVTRAGARPEIFALGIRSPQGLVLHPQTQEIWEAEMGPRGGDEVNIIEPGKNYGWPVITYGREYHGPRIGDTHKPEMEQPITYWVPSISPSAITFYDGNVYPQWKNNLFLATLSGQHIRRVVFEGRRVVEQEELLKEMNQRWRSIRQSEDGYLYLGTDAGLFGRLIEMK